MTALRVLGTSLEAEIGGAVALEFENVTLIPLHDHNGNIVMLLNPIGMPEKTYQYTAFGQQLYPDPNDINPWRFASKHFDAETGLIYFGHRYYDPTTARWFTPDPSDYDDGPNLYAYLHNNPLNQYDAYGLFGEGVWNGAVKTVSSIGNGIRSVASTTAEYGSQIVGGLARGGFNGYMDPIETASQMSTGQHWNPSNWQNMSSAEKVGFYCQRTTEAAGLAGNLVPFGFTAKVGIMAFKAAAVTAGGMVIRTIAKQEAKAFVKHEIKEVSKATINNGIIGKLNCLVPGTLGVSKKQINESTKYIYRSWYKSTFDNKMQTVRYHLTKHGNGRSYSEYTKDAMNFFKQNSQNATKVTLKDGKSWLSDKN